MNITLRNITLVTLITCSGLCMKLLAAHKHTETELARLRTIDEPVIIEKEKPTEQDIINSLPDDTRDFINKIAKITSISASFTQTEQDLANKDTKTPGQQKLIKGNLKLAKPNKLYWNINSPSTENQLYVTNGEKFWHYDKNLQQVVQDQFDNRRISNSPFYFLFSETTSLIEKFDIKRIGEKLFALTTKKQADFDSNYISELELKFNNKTDELEFVTFVAAKNKKVIVNLENVKINSKIDKSEFNFKVPKGVDIINAKEIY